MEGTLDKRTSQVEFLIWRFIMIERMDVWD
jgi:hypothetical protein